MKDFPYYEWFGRFQGLASCVGEVSDKIIIERLKQLLDSSKAALSEHKKEYFLSSGTPTLEGARAFMEMPEHQTLVPDHSGACAESSVVISGDCVRCCVEVSMAAYAESLNKAPVGTPQKENALPTIEEMSGLVEDFTNGKPLREYLQDIDSDFAAPAPEVQGTPTRSYSCPIHGISSDPCEHMPESWKALGEPVGTPQKETPPMPDHLFGSCRNSHDPELCAGCERIQNAAAHVKEDIKIKEV